MQAGLLERPAHLAGDLALADDDGFEAARHREEVLGDAVAVHEVESVAQGVSRNARAGADRVDRRIDGRKWGNAEGLVEVEVGLESVAGGHDDGAAQRLVTLEHVAGGRACADRQFLQHIEAGVLVTRGQTNQHFLILRAPGEGANRCRRGCLTES